MSDEDAELAENVALCRTTGWTLDYVESIDPVVRPKLIKIWSALAQAEAHQMAQARKGKG